MRVTHFSFSYQHYAGKFCYRHMKTTRDELRKFKYPSGPQGNWQLCQLAVQETLRLQSTNYILTSHAIYIRYTSVLFSHQCLKLPVRLFPYNFLTKILYPSLIPPITYELYLTKAWVQIIKVLMMLSYPYFYYVFSLRSKYSPRYFFLMIFI